MDVENDRAKKVGQWPAPSIALEPDMEKALGPDDAVLYKKALASLSLGYGIGACAYLRRVFEHQINPLLGLIRTARESEGASASELAEIDAAIAGGRGDNRTEILYRHVPKSLIVDGDNPLKLLYGDLSGALHTLAENESALLAQEWRGAFEFVLMQLTRERDRRKAYQDQVKHRRS